MGASELQEWAKFWSIEPWGPYRDNVHAGMLCALVVNALRKKGTRAVTFQDFMLVDREQHRKKKSAELISWMKAVGKKKKKNGGK